jgi:hypothetical protein
MFRALFEPAFYTVCTLVQLVDNCRNNPAEIWACLQFVKSLFKK